MATIDRESYFDPLVSDHPQQSCIRKLRLSSIDERFAQLCGFDQRNALPAHGLRQTTLRNDVNAPETPRQDS